MRGGRSLLLSAARFPKRQVCYSAAWARWRRGESSRGRGRAAPGLTTATFMTTAALMTTAATLDSSCEEEDDSERYAWLEAIESDEALAWVRAQNARTFETWGTPDESPRYGEILEALESKDKIPGVRKLGRYYYNFWTDAEHARGVLRRVLPEDYGKPEPPWETVLDVDALGAAENVSWVYKGSTPFRDKSGDVRRTLVALSPGGSDAVVRREFDLETKSFVEGGFRVDAASKNRFSWLDEDTLLAGVDLVEGDLTTSGYPRVVREWRRGEPLDSTTLKKVYEGAATDVSVSGAVTRSQDCEFEWRSRAVSFYTSNIQVRRHDADRSGTWFDLNALGLPEDADVSHFRDVLLIELRTDWVLSFPLDETTTFPAGSLLAVTFDDFTTNGALGATFATVFAPSANTSLSGFSASKDLLALVTKEDVKARLAFKRVVASSTPLQVVDVVAPSDATIEAVSVSAVDPHESNDFFLSTSSFLAPSALDLLRVAADETSQERLKSLPEMFDASTHAVSQRFATSKDGTKIPYFVVQSGDKDPTKPCLLYAYGGFEISLGPSYAPSIGRGWLSRGGTYVVANVRGGGEYGPEWHRAALRENRQLAYDDLHAVAEALQETAVVDDCKKRLAIRGGSNGGLLVANAYVQRQDLYGAVVCAVPLINMKRYTKLLAGASWMAEYGDPDSDDWDNFLYKYSPFHRIQPGTAYPPLLVTTSTKDDRVHPAHARSFVKKLQDLGVDNVWYYENVEGGHGGAADAKQSAFQSALYLDFLFDVLSSGPASPAAD